MYRVLIADDEIAICKGLSILIDWKAFGFEVVDYALNGLEAFEKIKEGKYDLVFTDIRMPEIDGIKLLRMIRENKYPCRIVILSGYKDFEYARSAVEYGAKNYILKPICEEILINTIIEIRHEIEEERIRWSSVQEGEQIIRQKLLKDLLEPGIDCLLAYNRCIQTGLKLDTGEYLICVAETEIAQNLLNQIEEGYSQQTVVMRTIADCIAEKYQPCYAFATDDGKIALLFCSERSRDITEFKQALEELFRGIHSITNRNLTIAVGNWVIGAQGIQESYRNACKALECKSNNGGDRIIYFDELSKNDFNKIVDDVSHYVREHYYEELSLLTISKLYFINSVYLGRLFKHVTGVNFTDYVTNIRVEKAAKLLESDKYMVYEISEKVGYKDINYFYKLFKAKMDVTPTEYRAKYKKSRMERDQQV